LAEVERQTGAEIALLRISDLQIIPCTGCETCIRKSMMGDVEFRCVTPRDADDTYFVEQQMRAADGIIVAAPAYGLMPPGTLVSLYNKMHAFGDYRHLLNEKKKVGAAITLGGTDWTNYVKPLTTMMVMDMVGGYERIADSMLVNFVPAPAMVAVDEDACARARLLGSRVAEMLKGEQTELPIENDCCPVCRTALLELRCGKLVCPNCEIEGEPMLMDGKLGVHFSEEAIEKRRWGDYGHKLHFSNIGKGHQKAAVQRGEIEAKRKEYAALYPCVRPERTE
jgi:multimeric flavodoxin WrbA